MTRLDFFKTAPTQELAKALCDLVQEYAWMMEEVADGFQVFPHPCKACPGYKTCKPGKNGFEAWLQEEAEE